MAIQFPADPAAQTPINTFSPNSTPVANTANSLVYVWNGSAWVGSGDPADVTPNLQAVTDQGSSTTNNINVTGSEGEPGIFIAGDTPGDAGFPNSINFGPFAPDPAEPWGHVGAETISVHSDSGSINVTNTDGSTGVSLMADGSGTFSGKVTSAKTVNADPDNTLATKSYVDANSGGDNPGTPGVRYQEGTWTQQTSKGACDGNDMFWSRTGNLVTVNGVLSNFTNKTANEAIELGGLPYTSQIGSYGSATGRYVAPGSVQKGQGITMSYTGTDSSSVKFLCTAPTNDDAAVVVKYNNFGQLAATIWFQVSYITDDTTFAPDNDATVTTDIQGTGGGSGSGASAWGHFDGANILGNHNIGSVTAINPDTTDGVFDVVWETPMSSENYSITIGGNAANAYEDTARRTAEGTRFITLNTTGSGVNTLWDIAVFEVNAITPAFTWTRDGTTLSPANSGDTVRADRELTIGTWADNDVPAVQLGKTGEVGNGIVKIKGASSNKSAVSIRVDGNTSGDEVASIKADGSANFTNGRANNFEIILEPDNLANYVTTMVDGEEQQDYSGPVLNVRETLLNLQSKVQSLEAEIETLKGGN